MATSAGSPGVRVRVERGVYRQPNGKYAVCFMLAGRPRFRTVDGGITAARAERERLTEAARAGGIVVSPRLRFATVAGWWIDRFAATVAAGERRERTLQAHRYHLDRNLLPTLGAHRIQGIGVEDVACLLTALRAKGCSEKTTDVDLDAGSLHVAAQLSRARRGHPARRSAPKTPSSVRDVPLAPQLAALLDEHRRTSGFAAAHDWVFATAVGTPLGSATPRAARCGAPPKAPDSSTASGHRCASTTCATPSQAT